MKNIVIYGCGGLGMETAQLIEDINKVNKWLNLNGSIFSNPNLTNLDPSKGNIGIKLNTNNA